MTWFNAKRYIESCVESWQVLKAQFDGKEREILEKKSYLVIDYHTGQIELSRLTLEAIALHHPHLLKQSYFIELVKKKVWLRDQNQKHQNGKLQKDLEWTEARIKTMEPKIELNPFTIEVRFQQLNFGLIQRLKKSKFVDRSKIDITKVSIKVVLKSGPIE